MHYLQFTQENGLPDCVLGHSLGEYSALWAADVFDFETGLAIVKKRGEVMAQITQGGMAAVIGLSLQEVTDILTQSYPALDIANINTDTQIVISGPLSVLEKAQATFEDAFASVVPLAVSGAFHSRYMTPIVRPFADFSDQFAFLPPLWELFFPMRRCMSWLK